MGGLGAGAAEREGLDFGEEDGILGPGGGGGGDEVEEKERVEDETENREHGGRVCVRLSVGELVQDPITLGRERKG